MPNILFPNVPNYPGVPQLLRQANAAIASNPALSIGIGSLKNILGQASQQAPQWGIFDLSGNQLGVSGNGPSIVQALTGQLTGQQAPVMSTLALGYTRETRVSDFPVEGGELASYNKVQLPANPVVTLVLSGSEDDRTRFLEALEYACISTDGYSVVTPEYVYANYSVERFTYSRKSNQGATLLIVEVSLKEIRQVSAAFTISASPINQPQNPAATPQVNSGMTQGQTADQSTLLSITSKITQLLGAQ